jgi:hypothetical protein
MHEIVRIGLDIAKRWFQVRGVDEADKEVFNRKLPRDKILGFFGSLPPCEVALEACSSSHYLTIFWLASYAMPPSRVTLDIDDTCDVVHGHQQLSLFNAHYDQRCFLPIHVYDTDKSRPVAVILRPGKTRLSVAAHDVFVADGALGANGVGGLVDFLGAMGITPALRR